MKQITVNGCHNCPFLNSDYDDFAVGHSTIDECKLSEFLGKESFISAHDNLGSDPDIETPIWCPLLNEKFELKFEKYDEETKNKINIIKKEVNEIEECCDNNDVDETMYTSLCIRRMKTLTELNEIAGKKINTII